MGNVIFFVLIITIPAGYLAKVIVGKIIKAIHKRWKDADLFKGLKEE